MARLCLRLIVGLLFAASLGGCVGESQSPPSVAHGPVYGPGFS
jgi:hypothetical protein